MPTRDGVSRNGLKTGLAVVLLLLILSAGAAQSVSAAMLDVEPDSYEPDDSWEQATELIPGIPQSHNFRPVGTDVDWLTFTLTETSEVFIQTDAGDAVYDTYMWLYDANLNLIDRDDDDGLHGNSRIERFCSVNALAPGTYYVKVTELRGNWTVLSYTISLDATSPCPEPDEYELDNSWEQATGIVPGVPQVHSIRPSNDEDWLTFDVPGASAVSIEVSTGPYHDPELWLYDASLTQIDYDMRAGPNTSSVINRTCADHPLSAGTYYVRVSSWSSDILFPSYTISFETSPCVEKLISPWLWTTDTTPRYRWTEVAGATGYTLSVRYSDDGVKVWRKTYAPAICRNGVCAVTPQRAQGHGHYEWTVTADTPEGEATSKLGLYSIASAVPELIGPLRPRTDPTPRYLWTAADGATAYELLVTHTATGVEEFRKTYATRICAGGRCSVTPQRDLPLGDYTWQVRAITDSGGVWSAKAQFAVY